METMLDLVTRYPELVEYILGFSLLLIVTSLVCLYLNKAKDRWVKVLKASIRLCGSSLLELHKGHPSFMELKVINILIDAVDKWNIAHSLGHTGSPSLDNYFNGKEGYLYNLELAYRVTTNLNEKSDVVVIFDILVSSMWRLDLVTSRLSTLSVMYMELSRILSRKNSFPRKVYDIIAKNINGDVDDEHSVSGMQWIRKNAQ